MKNCENSQNYFRDFPEKFQHPEQLDKLTINVCGTFVHSFIEFII